MYPFAHIILWFKNIFMESRTPREHLRKYIFYGDPVYLFFKYLAARDATVFYKNWVNIFEWTRELSRFQIRFFGFLYLMSKCNT